MNRIIAKRRGYTLTTRALVTCTIPTERESALMVRAITRLFTRRPSHKTYAAYPVTREARRQKEENA